jgi:hypothetical protein
VTSAVIERPSTMRIVPWAGVLGTVVEWYDFVIHGAAAALVMNVTHAIGSGTGASWMPELIGTRVR